MSAVWFLVHTKHKQDDAVLRQVQALPVQLGCQAMSPRCGSPSTEPLFPGYVFVGVDKESAEALQTIRRLPGVSRLLTLGKVPVKVPGGLVSALCRSAPAPARALADVPDLDAVCQSPHGGQRNLALMLLLSRLRFAQDQVFRGTA